ncbi:hypothetical protein [Oharaeibacter diazotrophicus]|uniref:DUF3828 domain-containing protein n=1 Tax=Oharaeibacter diazotrophicus TaxID=1920512 RepID=A0A4R6RKK1_9HYPH|nr:hypothetical protein [Oharaeibacter diazotrophicus]TDP87103.1 hypothetical protein EDD54_0989 [Oharaeibacter diazotrophicus]BBE70954.1 hypothetical protein OHA_1_00523 [Pleomorphomonas sp. SM30]GLS77703.1 hypothetical protein GCM10007904_30400 [Oharaeibacter diazotrophicus]
MPKTLAALALLLAGTAAAVAATPAVAPVEKIVAVMYANWGNGDPGATTPDGVDADYFAPALLDGVYSARIAALYREAAKHPAFDVEDDATGSPFDYDPIVGGQDGCPLEDLKVAPGATTAGRTEVVVTFKNMRCFEGNDAATREHVSRRVFVVVTENGHAVVDDVVLDDTDASDTLSKRLAEIAALPQ